MHSNARLLPLVALACAPAVFLFGSMLASSASAQSQGLTGADRPRIGLVLSGGGARGAAHVGVLKVLEELHVPVDIVVGTSMGAIVGASYVSGLTVAEMERRIAGIRSADIVRDDPPRGDRSARSKRDDLPNFIGPEFGVGWDGLRLPKGAVSGVGLEALLRSLVRQGREPGFDALPIPFRAVATDFENGRMRVLSSGDLATALRASMSIPGVFAPIEIDGRMLVDGGLTRNLPVDVARQMGAEILIAVNLGTPLLRRDQVTSILGVTAQMINILTEQNVRDSLTMLTPRDILISPDLRDFTIADFDRMSDAVAIGEAAARLRSGPLLNLALSPEAYAAHRAARIPVAVARHENIDEIRFTGLEKVNAAVLHSQLSTQAGRPLDQAVLDADLGRLYGRGDFERLSYRVVEESGRRILVIDAREKAIGPDYLRFGLGLSNDFSGNAYFQAHAAYRRTWLNALGAEWRTDLRLGRVNQLVSEFYQPLNARQSVFAAPYVDLEQKPFDLFQGRDRIARFSRQSGIAGFDIGADLGWPGEIRAGLYRGRRSFALDTGPSTLLRNDEAIDLGGVRLRWRLDQLDHGQFPRHGQAFSLDVIASQPALGGRDRYTRWQADYVTAITRGDHTVQLAAHAGGALGGPRLPNYDVFQFGGFMQLSGLRSGQLLGQSVVFGRAVYANRLVGMPLLSGLFGGVSLEVGRVKNPLAPGGSAGTIGAGSVFLATDTPVGPVYLGLGHASGGNNALYLYLGVP